MRWRYYAITIIFIGIFSSPFFLYSQSLQEAGGDISSDVKNLQQEITKKRNTIEELEKSIAKVKKEISQKRVEAVSLKNQMAILDKRITETELDITLTQEKLDALQLELESLGFAIGTKEQHIAKQKIILAELLRTISYDDGKNDIQILTAYDTFSDFYNRLQYLHTVEKDLVANTRTLQEIKKDLQDKHSETEKRKVAIAALRSELVEKKDDLEEQVQGKEDLFRQTKLSEATFTTLLGSLRKQYQDTENEISSFERQMRQKLVEQERLNRLNQGGGSGTLSWPTQSRYITAYFHDPDYPFRHVFEHNAVDIRAAQGTAVRAAASGFVGRAKRCTTASCYSYVMLIHADGVSTVYGHLSRIEVQEEQFVTRGDIIGYSGGRPGTVGAGPFVTGPHLHFEVRKDGIPVNPLNYLLKDL